MKQVVVLGAGVAGLTAAAVLERAGLSVVCLEARDRLGGRIHTVHDPLSPVPVELGAEFIHGRAPEVFSAIGGAVECEGRHVAVGIGGSGDRVMEEVERTACEERDETFAAFLRRHTFAPEEERAATAFVELFNAADAERISTAALAMEMRAADSIDGDRQFRLPGGYDALPRALYRGPVRLNSVVERVRWSAGSVMVDVRGGEVVKGDATVITVPLGVLRAGAIRFEPEPVEAMTAARALCFGSVVKVALLFDRAFWRDRAELRDALMLHTGDPAFPTWWTSLPLESPLLVGWSAGTRAERLAGMPVVEEAMAALQRVYGAPVPARLVRAWHHDWSADPFALGAYSYVPAGGLSARRRLAEPVDSTLFFAGEATDTGGHTGTVHGAIASGMRAAEQVLASYLT